MAIAIKAENISKQYRLGYVGSGSLKDDARRWWSRMRGKEDPLLKIGETNDRSTKAESDYVWALKDINFEIEQGDTVGIIGRNGAGKSTLLKLLSKVTAPTTGNIKVKGRIASLLEVGTGFHPELTGRENIYLNGAIMGMRKHEITRKLDEIVDFAGVERYLDTPVKRYSSGMYVRLGFAVAAHLENEILIVDEVLAVGDAEFQKKCLGKLSEVANGEGRTIFFVSHNVGAIQKLCKSGMLLSNGMLIESDKIDYIVGKYVSTELPKQVKLSEIMNRHGNKKLYFTNGYFLIDNLVLNRIESGSRVKIVLEYLVMKDLEINSFRLDVGINNKNGDRICLMTTEDRSILNLEKNIIEFYISKLPLAPGAYNLNIYAEINGEVCDWLQEVLPFTIIDKDYYNTGKIVTEKHGCVLLEYKII